MFPRKPALLFMLRQANKEKLSEIATLKRHA